MVRDRHGIQDSKSQQKTDHRNRSFFYGGDGKREKSDTLCQKKAVTSEGKTGLPAGNVR